MAIESVLDDARKAKAAGATRFCMGAAWRSPKDKDLDAVCEMVEGVKAMGMETCVTLGMLTGAQAQRLKGAGLDYYNHNIDTSPEYYSEIITTRTFQDRLDTLEQVRNAGINVCCGWHRRHGRGGERPRGHDPRAGNLAPASRERAINALVQVKGTRLGDSAPIDGIDFVRMIAVARIAMPKSFVRLSAGRGEMSDETQALCFLAGANSIFYGDKLLTTPNPEESRDMKLLARLGIAPMAL